MKATRKFLQSTLIFASLLLVSVRAQASEDSAKANEPAQVSLKVRLIEIKDDSLHALGFEWYLTSFLASGTNTTSLAGIPTAPQLKVLLKALSNKETAELLNETEITTLSGREAQFELIGLKTKDNADTNSVPLLDVVPSVSADGYSIQLALTSTITETVDNSTPQGAITSTTNSTAAIEPTSMLPRTKVRQVVTRSTVRDGQTVVMLFKHSGPRKNNIYAFVTPTVIDAAGNRKNLDENMPFAQNAVPSQPPPMRRLGIDLR